MNKLLFKLCIILTIIQSHDELRVKPFGHGHRKIMIPTMNGLARHGCDSRRHEGIWYVGDSIICIFPPHKKCSAFRSRLLKRGEIANEGIEHTTGTAGIQPLLRSHTKDVKIPMWLSKPFQRRTEEKSFYDVSIEAKTCALMRL